MLRIISHLEYLLKVYDCVIIPKLGGFVLQAVPASHNVESHLFRPMHKEVVFNASLKYDDGLLAEQYMNSFGVSFQRARRMLEEDVEEIKSLLFKELKVSLGNAGTLHRGTEGQIMFESGENEFFSLDSYGLFDFQVKTWEELQRENEKFASAGKSAYYLPVNRKILRGIASTAAAIALFLTISTPVKEINPSSYAASFIPSEIVKTHNKTSVTPPTTKAMPVPVKATSRKTTTSSSTDRKTAEKAIEKRPLYYVVISSVKTKEQADEVISKVERAGIKSVNKIVVSNKIRVYANKFTDKNKAETYLSKIQKNPKYRDAWIYTRNK
jgi:cell division septation protein DedD